MKLATTLLALAATIALGAAPAAARRPWLLPSATSFSGDESWVTFDAAASDGLFYFDLAALPLDGIKAYAPDGTPVQIENASTGKLRSTFDLHLTQKGTYKVENLSQGLFGGYKQDGEMKRLPRDLKPADLGAAIPAGATEVKVTEMSGRNITWVTAGAPTDGVLKAAGSGLEIVPITHPNDLVAGEQARFQLTVDGKPAADLPVTVVAQGTRYRDQLGQLDLRTDAKGILAVTWPTPGMYWLSATVTDARTSIPGATERRLTLAATVEVVTP